jgi:hypothetical protein
MDDRPLDPGLAAEQFCRQMLDGAGPCGADAELAGIALRKGDKLGQVAHRQVVVDQQQQRHPGHAGDRREVFRDVERQRRIERGPDEIGGRGRQDRVAVRGGLDHATGGDIAAGTGTMFEREGLAETRRQQFADGGGQLVGGSAGCERNDPGDRPGGIGLGPCRKRSGNGARGHRGPSCGTQPGTSGKPHILGGFR